MAGLNNTLDASTSIGRELRTNVIMVKLQDYNDKGQAMIFFLQFRKIFRFVFSAMKQQDVFLLHKKLI